MAELAGNATEETASDWASIDRALRGAFVRAVQHGEDVEAARDQVLEACDRAAAEGAAEWRERWRYLLEILRDISRQPPAAQHLRALAGEPDGLRARILLELEGGPIRAGELAKRLDRSLQQISTLTARLEKDGLIKRLKAEGRTRYAVLTPNGRRVLELMPRRAAGRPHQEQPGLAERLQFWRDPGTLPPIH